VGGVHLCQVGAGYGEAVPNEEGPEEGLGHNSATRGLRCTFFHSELGALAVSQAVSQVITGSVERMHRIALNMLMQCMTLSLPMIACSNAHQ
jgi:hypothetical protein